MVVGFYDKFEEQLFLLALRRDILLWANIDEGHVMSVCSFLYNDNKVIGDYEDIHSVNPKVLYLTTCLGRLRVDCSHAGGGQLSGKFNCRSNK